MTLEEKSYTYDQICEIINNRGTTFEERLLFVSAFCKGIYWKISYCSNKIYRAKPENLLFFGAGGKLKFDSFLSVKNEELAMGKSFNLANYNYDWAIDEDEFKKKQ